MNDSKHILTSTTVQSALVGLLVLLSQVFKLDLDAGILTELVQAVIGLVAVCGVIYGRLKAKHDLTIKK